MSARAGSLSLAGEGRIDEPRTNLKANESSEYCWLEERKGTFSPFNRPKALFDVGEGGGRGGGGSQAKGKKEESKEMKKVTMVRAHVAFRTR